MFLITLKQVAILLGYILLGFVLCKTKVVGKDGSKVLSKLLVCVFSPAYNILSLMRGISIEKISQYALCIGCGAGALFFALVIALVLCRLFSKDKLEQSIYQYVFIFSNIGYFGSPLVGAVYGAEVLAQFILFCLPLTIGINTYAYFILTRNPDAVPVKKKKADILKRIFSIPTVAVLIGLVLGLLPIEIPAVIDEIIAPASNCMSATAMIIAGIVLSTCSMKEVFLSVKSYLVGLIRLIILPIIIGGIGLLLYKFAGLDKTIFICIVTFSCLPPGMNAIVFPESAGLSGKTGAKACFLSYIFALGTIPLCFYLLSVFL